MPRKVFVTQNEKTNFHSFFEVVPSNFAEGRDEFLDVDVVDAFIKSRTLQDIASILEATGPLIAKSLYKKEMRTIAIDDAIEIAMANGRGRASEGYTKNDEAFLRLQLFLDGNTAFYPSQASIARAVRDLGLLESNAVEDLKDWKIRDPGCHVVIEPLSDVVECRNLCSLSLRLIANINNLEISDEEVLVKSGFKLLNRKRKWWINKEYKDSYYVLPITHNAGYDMTLNFSTKWWGNVFAYMLINPLHMRIASCAPKKNEIQYGSISNAVGLCPDMTGKPEPIFNYGKGCLDEETQYFLGLETEGSQREEARCFVSSLSEMMANLRTEDGSPLGWEVSLDNIMDDDPMPVFRFHTLAGTMFASVLFRYGTTAVACRKCGNGMLIKSKGKRREFCSNSCRTQYYAKGSSSPNICG